MPADAPAIFNTIRDGTAAAAARRFTPKGYGPSTVVGRSQGSVI